MENVIAVGDHMFVALCKAGQETAARPSYHAVAPNVRKALCVTEPRAGSEWAEPPAEAVTCPPCLRRLERMRRKMVQPTEKFRENDARVEAIEMVKRLPHLDDLLVTARASGGSWVRTLETLETAAAGDPNANDTSRTADTGPAIYP
jgi:hypothetical protein